MKSTSSLVIKASQKPWSAKDDAGADDGSKVNAVEEP
jgi:hypothetical protein